jgi:hypothetical protein
MPLSGAQVSQVIRCQLLATFSGPPGQNLYTTVVIYGSSQGVPGQFEDSPFKLHCFSSSIEVFVGLQKIRGIERDVQVIMNGDNVRICKAAVTISLHLLSPELSRKMEETQVMQKIIWLMTRFEMVPPKYKSRAVRYLVFLHNGAQNNVKNWHILTLTPAVPF